MLADVGRETHLVVTEPGAQVLTHETGLTLEQVAAKATKYWEIDDLFALPSSGSFPTAAMVVAPCSIRTLSAVATCSSSNLLERAADVTLKERRPLVLLVRETPLHVGHLRLMVQASEMGATVMPPLPAFYHQPQSLQDMVDHTAGKVMDLLGVAPPSFPRWQGR
jgi:4-hydroxy-3-polyprenylbenzoate decarboxylase